LLSYGVILFILIAECSSLLAKGWELWKDQKQKDWVVFEQKKAKEINNNDANWENFLYLSSQSHKGIISWLKR
jgi:predicted phosphoadenosine phosphosulfate sulfurtransferase